MRSKLSLSMLVLVLAAFLGVAACNNNNPPPVNSNASGTPAPSFTPSNNAMAASGQPEPTTSAYSSGAVKGTGYPAGNPTAETPNMAASKVGKTVNAHGIVKSIDPDHMGAEIMHNDIPELQMKAMTMKFKMAGNSVLNGINTGDEVNFVITEYLPDGNYAVTSMTKAAKKT
jgi:Cu/Ag efflux protein CusF